MTIHILAPTFPATCPLDHEGKWGKEERTRYNLSRLNKKTRHCRKRGITRTLDPVEDASLKKTEEKWNDLASSKKDLKQNDTGNGRLQEEFSNSSKYLKRSLSAWPRGGCWQCRDPGSVTRQRMKQRQGHTQCWAKGQSQSGAKDCKRLTQWYFTATAVSTDVKDTPKATALQPGSTLQMYLSFFKGKKETCWSTCSFYYMWLHTFSSSQGWQTLACTRNTAHPPTEMEKVPNKKCLKHGFPPQVWWLLVPWLSLTLSFFFVICPKQH